MSLDIFALMISNSVSLRYLNVVQTKASSSISPIQKRIMRSIIEQNGSILLSNSHMFSLDAMVRRNQDDLKRCRAACETLLALKKQTDDCHRC